MLLYVLLVLCALTAATPAPLEDLSFSQNESYLWGPFRPNLYFGMRPRMPNSLLMGLMWSNADDPSKILKNLRHTCEQDEGMAGYGWATYDLRKGGTHVVNDTGNKVDIITQFVRDPDEQLSNNWGLRIKGVPRTDAATQQKTTIVFYVGSEELNSTIQCAKTTSLNGESVCGGTSTDLGTFKLQISSDMRGTDAFQSMAIKSLKVPGDTIWQAKNVFGDQLKVDDSHGGLVSNDPGAGNLHFIQQSFDGGFEFDVLFSSAINDMTATSLTHGIRDASSSFEERFESAYAPQSPFQDKQHAKFSKYLLSNLMGGIGYFYGTSKVADSLRSGDDEAGMDSWKEADSLIVKEEGPYELLSAVPSRPFFPRGFLWDEGFHLLVILDWDMDLALEIVSSWLNLMDFNGWIAKEQILGQESASKVPNEFRTQYPNYANPPTLFLVIEAFIAILSGETPYSGAPSRYLSDPAVGKAFLEKLYIKANKYYEWFCHTQASDLQNYQLNGSDTFQGYRWRGRTPQHILTSGLDDYPRAQSPNPEELHLDALCWVGSMAKILGKMSTFMGEKKDQVFFSKQEADVVRSFDSIHWSDDHQAYCDTTIGEDNRVEKVCHKGYVSLFPFLVGLLSPDHPHLEAILQLIRDPEELWSPYGIRSLSLQDGYYGTDENYWRSPIWININYMILQQLLEHAQRPGPYRQTAREMYTELRVNLVDTVFESWRNTGFAWEQYNPDTGKGQRTQHFTGWTSLIARVMAMPDLKSEYRLWAPGHTLSTGNESWSPIVMWMGFGLLLVFFVSQRRIGRIWEALKVKTRTLRKICGGRDRTDDQASQWYRLR